MNLKVIFKNYWILLLTTLVMFFWLGFFCSENLYNQNTTTYSILLESDNVNLSDIDVDFFLKALEKVDDKGNITYSYATVKPKEFFNNNDISLIEDYEVITISIKAKYFIGSDEATISEKSLDRYLKVMKKVIGFHDSESLVNGVKVKEFSDPSTIKIDNYVNPYIVSIFTLGGGFLLFASILFIFRNKLEISNENIYENSNIFSSPFSKKYWIKAINSFKKMKIFDMCLIAILFALQILLKFVSNLIPSGFANLGLGLPYLVFAYISLIYGPIWGLVIGFSSDVVGFIIEPTIFHPGYTLQAMLTGFVYGLCLYRTDLKFSKVLLCRIIINILLNGIFGAFLWGSYAKLNYEATITYMTLISLPKNIIYLIPQSLLLYFFLRAATPLLIRKNIVPKEVITSKIA